MLATMKMISCLITYYKLLMIEKSSG
uniref:Uncharacterized protein n=1 Tax=Rhizophora mucronata TaxID=61149 RepID=A0A2P2NK92_RHIMU